jgi:hypothetical protein
LDAEENGHEGLLTVKRLKPIYGWIVVLKDGAPEVPLAKPFGTFGIHATHTAARNSFCWNPEQVADFRKFYRTARIKISEVK